MGWLPVAVGLWLIGAPGLAGQAPTISPAAERLMRQDSSAALWFFVRPEYSLEEAVAALSAAGARVRRESVWLHAVSAQVPRAAWLALSRDPRFERVQPVVRFRGPLPPAPQLEPAAPPRAPLAEPFDSLYGPSAMPFRRLNLAPLAMQGIRGKGVRIAILDSGFETGHPAFANAAVIAQRDFVFDDDVVRNQPGDAPQASRHGTATWSLLAADVPGTLIGVAPEAEYLLAKTEDVRSETKLEEDNYVAALEWAAALGARVVSSSLGYLTFDGGSGYTFSQLNGDIAVTTVAADLAAQRGLTVVTAVGNGGPNLRTLVTPADADSAIAVGAEDSTGQLATFSSRGPTADGRIKPDVTAPGVRILVVDTDPACTSGFCRLNGTSFATPLIAGAAALIRQLHPQLTGVEVGDALRRSGNAASNPDNNRGFGLPDVLAAATFPYGLVLSSPQDSLLASVTPTFTWVAPGVPAFGQPVGYRFILTRSDSANAVVLDTSLSGSELTLRKPQRPGRRLRVSLQATAANGARLTRPARGDFITPPWADLLTLDDPSGTTVRDARPRLQWTSPQVSSPPGPFTYDVEIFRTDNLEVVARAAGLDSTAFTPPSDLEPNTPYRWRVTARLGADTAIVESRGAFVVVDGSVPPLTLLFQNFPNPFPNLAIGTSATCFWFDLARTGSVRLEILDLRGHRVRTLIPGPAFPDPLPAGRYGRPGGAAGGRCDANLEWDGSTESGDVVPRGIYLAKLTTPDGVFFKRIVFLGAR